MYMLVHPSVLFRSLAIPPSTRERRQRRRRMMALEIEEQPDSLASWLESVTGEKNDGAK